MKRNKISIVGAGNIGGTLAYLITQKGLGNVVLVDVVEGIPQGKALDIAESTAVTGNDSIVIGKNSYEDIADSDIVVVTAGVPRKPGMSRDDLLSINSKIMQDVAGNIKKYAPDSIVIVVSNPLDIMVYLAYKLTGFPKNRVIGMAGVLDTARFCYFIAEELKVSVGNVSTMVLGGHGDQMIPLVKNTTVGGIPLTHFMPDEKIAKLVERTRNGGAEIVNLLKTGSAYFAPSSSVAEMIEAILLDKKKILPCAAYLEGEYGATGIFMGVPVKLGKTGVEEIIELDLNPEEKEAFEKNVAHIKEMVERI